MEKEFISNNSKLNNIVIPNLNELEENCINIYATDDMTNLFLTDNEILKSLEFGQKVDFEKVITRLSNGVYAHKVNECCFLDDVNLKFWSIETNHLLAFQTAKKEDKVKTMK